MVGVGIGWASILSMPYALLANGIPAARMGFYMGVFNFFIVLPQILAATLLGKIVEAPARRRGMPVVMAGGVSLSSRRRPSPSLRPGRKSGRTPPRHPRPDSRVRRFRRRPVCSPMDGFTVGPVSRARYAL